MINVDEFLAHMFDSQPSEDDDDIDGPEIDAVNNELDSIISELES